VTHVSDGFLELTGYTRGECVGINCRFLQGAETDRTTVQQMRTALDAGRDTSVTLLNYRKGGAPFWNLLHLEHVRGPTIPGR
jgi:PAS domain S-box-containing protein